MTDPEELIEQLFDSFGGFLTSDLPAEPEPEEE